MASPWARDRGTFFYLGFGLIGLLVVALGFGVTYALPMVRRTFSAPWYVHLHGASALGWIVLLILQAQLVRRGKLALHRRLGQGALPLALAIWVTGVETAVWAAERDLPALGTVATSSVGGTFMGLAMYVLLVLGALATRRTPSWHKRLVMLATIQLLWPAFFRLRHLLPSIPNPDVWLALVLAYTPVFVAAMRDQVRYGKVHPVWLFVGPALIVEQSLEFVFFDQGALRRFGQWLYALLA